MAAQRVLFTLSFTFCLICLAGFILPTSAATKIGVFPLRTAAGLESELATDLALTSLTDGLLRNLQEAELGEIVLLPWPEALVAGDLPTFETLVGRGKEAGCNGVLALQVTALSFSMKEIKLPLVGTVKSAEAKVKLLGGLVDVGSALAVAPVDVTGQNSSKNYKGPAPAALAQDPAKLADSPLGKASAEALSQVVAAVKTGIPQLSTQAVALPQRASSPPGAGFSQDSYAMEITMGYDQRSTVAVVNRGTVAETFLIKPLEQVTGLMVGLVGQGSVDGPFTLAPGQWKYTRLEVHCFEQPEAQIIPVRLGLYSAAAGAAPNQAGPPQDEAVVNLTLADEGQPYSTKLLVLGQDPVTLVYTCSIVNSGSEPASLGLSVAPEQERLFTTVPALGEMFVVPPQSSLTFYVFPHFPEGIRQMDVALGFPQQQGWVAAGLHATGGADTLRLHFEVPAGKYIYTALSSTSQDFGGAGSGCTNQGKLTLAGNSKKGSGSQKGDHKSKKKDSTWQDWVRDNLGLDMSTWGEDDTTTTTTTTTRPKGKDGCPPGWSKNEDSGKCQPPSFGSPGNSSLRGAIVRPAVSARLPGLDSDTSTQPALIIAKRKRAAVFHTPANDDKVGVFIGISADQPNGTPQFLMLNEGGHTARWPAAWAEYTTAKAYVVWEDSTSGGTDVAFRTSADKMASWRPVVYLTQSGAGVMDPVVRTSSNNLVMVAWQDLRAGESVSRIYTRTSRDGGATFAPEVPLPQAEGEQQSWPQLDSTADGHFALVYVSKVGGQPRILSRLLDDAGKPLDEPVALSNPGMACGEPKIVCDGEGGRHSAWREGEGSASEIWFATSPTSGAPWSQPRQITQDQAYSEYPAIGLGGDGLWIRYHSDSSGVADMAYVVTSADGGATWGEAVMLPTHQSAIERAWVEVNFALQWPDQVYAPHDTQILVNGVEVGNITGRVPQGTFVFDVPPELIIENPETGLDSNVIMTQPSNLNGAHYIRAANARLVVKRRSTQVQVVAGSQAEADQLAKTAGVDLNHDKPDLALAANLMAPVPTELKPGATLALALQVFNIGEAAATEVKVALYAADPRVPSTNLKEAKLAEQAVGNVAPGQVVPANLSFKFDPKRGGRVWVAVQAKEADFNPTDNCWILSFTQGESDTPTPLLGTDVPNVFQAPGLMGMVQLPNVPALTNLVSLPNFGNLVSIPGLQAPDLGSIGNVLNSQIGVPGINLPDLGNILNLP